MNINRSASLFFIALLLVLPYSSAVYAETYATNLDTGETISLSTNGGITIVTNLETGETVEVDGQFEGMTDEEYTDLMRQKLVSEEIKAADRVIIDESLSFSDEGGYKTSAANNSVSGRYSVGDGHKYYTGTYNIGSANRMTVGIWVDGDVGNYDYIYVTLIRQISYWPDKSYGRKTFRTTQHDRWYTNSWSNLPSNKQYYLRIEKKNTPSWSWGSWYMTW